MWFSVAVIESLDMWDSTPLIFTGFTIVMITVFACLSFLGVPFLPYPGMALFWCVTFIPTLLIDTAALLRHAHKNKDMRK